MLSGTRRERLQNGLNVLVHEVHTAPLVSVWCWYRVGSGDESPGRTGASHWVEHMNFKGTRNIPREQMKGLVERFGGMWNGYTWLDQTTYVETAGRDALDQQLEDRLIAALQDEVTRGPRVVWIVVITQRKIAEIHDMLLSESLLQMEE